MVMMIKTTEVSIIHLWFCFKQFTQISSFNLESTKEGDAMSILILQMRRRPARQNNLLLSGRVRAQKQAVCPVVPAAHNSGN